MKKEDRKAAIAAYKERKPVAGIYAVRAAATGEIWVGASTVLDKVENRIRFTLRYGNTSPSSARRAWNDLKAAWDACGPDGLSFEEVEILDEEVPACAVRSHLEERLAYWAGKLAARMI